MAEASKSTFLLHCCCAPCTTHPLKQLSETFDVTAFFYNPNIQPRDEYEQRLKDMETLARRWGFAHIVGPYDVLDWLDAVKGYEGEPEGGRRCEVCYRMRLQKTAGTARERGFDFFGTTLSVSPHKNAAIINRIGLEVGENAKVEYFEADFKKKDGFRISCRISRDEGLHRQNYCGCIYSRRGKQ